MKDKKILIGVIVVILIVVIAAIIILFNSNNSSTINIENKDDGSVVVTAKNASENSGGIGYITIAEGQKLEVKSDLTEGSIKIEVLPSDDTDSTTQNIMEESFTNSDTRVFELPAKSYSIRITADKNTTGSMIIDAK